MKMHKITDFDEYARQSRFERSIGEEVTKRLFDMKVFYILRWGSDPFTMFKLYVDITRGIKYGISD